MDKNTEMLIEELKAAAFEYYQNDGKLMTDEDYDNKLTYLTDLTNEDPSLLEDQRVYDLVVGSVSGGTSPDVPEDEVVIHSIQMGSLDKAKNKDKLKSYFDKTSSAGASGYKLQAKLDGLALEVRFENGRPVLAATRGDGFVGQDVSYIINHPEMKVVGIPSYLSNIDSCSLRGELFIRPSQLVETEKNRAAAGEKEKFSLPRMAMSGMLKKAKDGLGYETEVTFGVYSAYDSDGELMELEKEIAREEGLVEINNLSLSEYVNAGGEGRLICSKDFDKLWALISTFGEYRGSMDIPTDGVVVRPINETYVNEIMGSTATHPKAYIAYKYPSETVTTEVLDMVYSTGKTGKITPKAIVKRVFVDGSYIENASCHNFNWLNEKGIRVGSIVAVHKANDIIPAIATVIEQGDGEQIMPLTSCPSCGGELQGDGLEFPKTLKCINIECPSQNYFRMRDVVGKQGLDIDGLNNVSLEALCATDKVHTVADFFKLNESDLSELIVGQTEKGNDKKFGKVRAKKVINLIENARTKTAAYKILNAFGFPGIGPSTCKSLLSEYKGIREVITASNEELAGLNGFSDVRASAITDNAEKAIEILEELEELGVVLDNGIISEEVADGKTYCISGSVPSDFSNRNDFNDYMESIGHKFSSSVNKNVDVVFWDGVKNSSKVSKANKLNIPLISPEEYKTI